MASEMVRVEMWVVVDQDGDYAVGMDCEAACETYESILVPLRECTAVRHVRVTIMVPKPRPVEITATLAEEGDVGTVSVQ